MSQSSTSTFSLPEYNGANLAPIQPLLNLREKHDSSHYLASALKEKYTHFIKKDEKAWREMIGMGQQIALFIEGHQMLDFNPYTQSYAPRQLRHSDPRRIKAVNFMQYFCTNWQSKWESSNPDVMVLAIPMQDEPMDLAAAKARKANMVVDHLERRFYDRWYNLHEGIQAQIWGWYGNRVRIDRSIQGSIAIRQILEDREVQIGQGFGKCYDCDHAGDNFNTVQYDNTTETPVCPECGSMGVFYEPPAKQIMQVPVGQEQVNLGDIVCDQTYFPAWRWDIKQRLEDSRWAIYEQDITPGMIRNLFGNYALPQGESGNQYGLDALSDLAAVGEASAGHSNTSTRSRPTDGRMSVVEMWLAPEDYADIKIRGDNKTIAGIDLPDDVYLTEVAPHGACFIGINGFSLLSGFYPFKADKLDSHANQVTSGVYHMKANSGTGRGVGDAVPIQKTFNRRESQMDRFWAVRGTPPVLHMAGAVSASDRKLLGQPDVDIPVNVQNFPEVKSIDQLIKPLQGESVPGDMFNATYNHLQNFMQLAYHITEFSGGLNPRVDNKTARGAMILDQNAQSLFSPALSIKADVRLKTAKKAFYLWVRNNPQPKFIPAAGGASNTRGMSISGANVAGEYDWSVAEGSEAPKNRLTRRQDAQEFYAQFGGFAGYAQLKQAFPKDVTEARRLWDMDMPRDDYDAVGEVCRNRFENAKQLLQKFQQIQQGAQEAYGVQIPPTDPMMVMQFVEPTILITETGHMEKALWFSQLLDTDEGQTMGSELRSLASTFVILHQQMASGQATMLAGEEAQVNAAANAPATEEQNLREDEKAEKDHQQKIELEKTKAEAKPKPAVKGKGK